MQKKKQREGDRPIGQLKRVADFLPPPEELIPEGELEKITIALDTKTIKFFKEVAVKYGLKYQRLMREILKRYAQKYST